jgi:glycosyltransferase involved in cell wall biosynthesis
MKIKYLSFNKKRSFQSSYNLFKYLLNTDSVVIFSTISHVNIMIYILNIFLKKKIIFRESNNVELNFKDFNILKRKFYNFFIKKINQRYTVIYPSKNLKEYIVNQNKIKNINNLVVINNPISIKINKSFDNESNSILNFIQKKFKSIILNIGSFTAQKNQIDLIEAFTKIDYLQNVCLILVGKGPQKKRYL